VTRQNDVQALLAAMKSRGCDTPTAVQDLARMAHLPYPRALSALEHLVAEHRMVRWSGAYFPTRRLWAELFPPESTQSVEGRKENDSAAGPTSGGDAKVP